jgi:DNA-binding response OmpR family regulator
MRAPVKTSHLAILYVEDDEATRRATTLILKRRYPQITLFSACNGKEGLEIFRNNKPGIVITDIVMPEMDGLRMAREIKAIVSGVQIIVTSASADVEQIVGGIDTDGCHCICKPINVDKLFSAIDGCIDCVIGSGPQLIQPTEKYQG